MITECDWNKNTCFYYLSEHVYLNKITDEDLNQSFVLINKFLKYQIVSKSKRTKNIDSF